MKQESIWRWRGFTDGRGQRAQGAVPKNYGESVTLIGAIDENGLLATLTFRGATDTAAMKVF